jgi:hypothetical protein
MIHRLRQYRAKRRDEREQYRRHRQAALKGLGRG